MSIQTNMTANQELRHSDKGETDLGMDDLQSVQGDDDDDDGFSESQNQISQLAPSELTD